MRSDFLLAPRTIPEIVGRCRKWLKFSIANASYPAAPIGFKSIPAAYLLSQATVNTAQTINLFTLPANWGVMEVQTRLRTPFKLSTDSAFNSDTLSVGITGTVAALMAAIELNANGTYVSLNAVPIPNAARGIQSQSASTIITATMNSMAGKALANLDTGLVDIFVEVVNYDMLDQIYENDIGA